MAEIRRMEEDELPTVALLCQRNLPFDKMLLSALAQQVYCDPAHDPELALVAKERGEVVGFCLGVLRRDRGWVKIIVVDERHRRRGIGSALLSRLEELLSEKGATEIRVGGSSPRYIWPGVDLRYIDAVIFFQRRGYELTGYAPSMVVDLTKEDFDTSKEEARLREEGIVVRRAMPEDEPSLCEFIKVHFDFWAEETALGFKNMPPSVFVAKKGEEIVGFAAYDVNNLGTGFFGPTGVRPDLRRKGIGGILLRRCMRDIKTQGLTEATISWTGLYHYYHIYTGAIIGRVFAMFRKAIKGEAKEG